MYFHWLIFPNNLKIVNKQINWLNFLILTSLTDANGNPVTQIIQSVGVTDASGNPVTGVYNKYN